MNINDLTIGQAKELANLFGNQTISSNDGINFAINEYVIIRTYSAGVWAGILKQKSSNEVILSDARRLWRWWAKKSISLSAVANFGINQDKCQIAPSVENIWLEAIEIIPTTKIAQKSIVEAKDANAQ